MAITTYTGSDGTVHNLADMAYPHLKAALNKRARAVGGGPDDVCDALRAELTRRDNAGGGQGASTADHTLTRAPDAATQRTTTDHRLAVGGNNPPPDADPLNDRLAEKFASLLDQIADHELAAGKLPKEVKSDDDVAAITAWVVKARALYRDLENARKEEKEEFLKGGRTVDAFFKGHQDSVTERAKKIESRSAPYLTAKAQREEAERQAREAEARRVAEEQARVEREAREAAERARREAEEAAEAQRRAATEAERVAAEERQRQALQTAQVEEAAADQAAEDKSRMEDHADKAAATDGHKLSRTAGGGGAAKVNLVWKARVKSWPALIQGLGPLGPYLSESVINDAIGRAARDDKARPASVPGVEFYQEAEVKTTAARS